MPIPAGTQLGRYTVLKTLVGGGLAEVLLARAEGMAGFAHHVVIKAIRSNKSTDPAFIRAFVDEARLAASLHHNHIVQVHDVGHENADYFFAMEYVHAENLRTLLAKLVRNRQQMPLEQVITIALAVASGLHHAHQQNIVHRDVTPANILVTYDGNVKVTDFGIAKAMLQSHELTKSGTMRGKVAYMAPEQCLGRPIDRRSDIFSLGIVLYELCTSRRLFKGDTDFLVMTAIVNGKIPKPTLHRANLPLELEDVILKALAPKPELRFATAEDLAIALERVAITNQLRVSSTALGEYLNRLFGTRPEPWLVDTDIVAIDVDFDGAGRGLAEIDDAVAPPPGMTAADPEDFADDQRTEIQHADDEDEPPTLTPNPSPPPRATSGFEGNERTLIGDEADVDMLVHMSKIDARRDTTPVPRRDATPVPGQDTVRTPRQDATMPPPGRDATTEPGQDTVPTPRRDATTVPGHGHDTAPTPRHDATPVPARRDATPVPAGARDAAPDTDPVRRDATPLPAPRRDATPAPTRPPIAPWASSPSGTGTPMAWSNDGDVTSLRPRGRRVMLIAAVAIPLVAIGVFAIVRRHHEPAPAAQVEPDAFVAPAIDAAIAADPVVTPDASEPDAAMTAAVPPDAGAPLVAPPVVKKPAAVPVYRKPVGRGPITKKPPLKR